MGPEDKKKGEKSPEEIARQQIANRKQEAIDKANRGASVYETLEDLLPGGGGKAEKLQRKERTTEVWDGGGKRR